MDVLTETWLKVNTEDQAWLNQSDFKQGNYDTLTHNRGRDCNNIQKTIQNYPMGQRPHVDH